MRFAKTLIGIGLLSTTLAGFGAQQPAREIVQFRAGGHILGFSPEGMVIAARTHALKIDFNNSQKGGPVAEGAATGNDAPPLTRVSYPDLWTGITLKYTATSAGLVESSYEVAPGADPGVIVLKTNVPGHLDPDGFLRYRFETGEMVESKPVAWQEIDGRKAAVEAAFEIRGESNIGFRVGAYDSSKLLTIDPIMTWNTFFGLAESAVDNVRAIACDGSAGIYVCGDSDGPWGSPVRSYGGGASDAFVAKFNAFGVRQWVTFLGGAGTDEGGGIVSDSSGHIYVVGTSQATWPTTGKTPKRPYMKNKDAFIAQLSAVTGVLQWNAFFGGNGDDLGTGLAFGSGNSGDFIYLTGTSSATWGSPIRGYTAGNDAFAAKISDSGVFQWNTFLGGSGSDKGNGIAFSSKSQAIFIVGDSDASWGTTIGRDYTASTDGFVAKLIGATGALQWNTFLGGSEADTGEGLAVDTTFDNIYVTGTSYGAWGTMTLRAFSGGADAYVVCVPGASNGLIYWNTFLGGSGNDFGRGLSLQGTQSIFLAGTSDATWGSPKESYAGGIDAFAVQLSFLGALQWNSFIGDSGTDEATGITNISGVPVIAGTSDEGPWAAGTPISAYAGDRDGFLAKLTSSGVFSLYTFLGGMGRDEGKAVDVDGFGNVYVAGTSYGAWGQPVRDYKAGADAFAAKLDPSGALLWNTFLGGAKDDLAAGVAVTAAGLVYVTGSSGATWGNPVRPFGGGGQDAFAAKLNSSGILQWNTFLGGSGGDCGNGIAVDEAGNAYVTGYSPATWGSPVRGYSSSNDAFAAGLNADGELQWNTFLGGSGSEIGNGIAVDGSGNTYVAGAGTKTWGSPIRGFTSSSADGFAAKLNSSGVLQWNTFLGGTAMDGAGAIAVYEADTVYVSGYSMATWGSPLARFSGAGDAFAAKLNGNGALQWLTFFGSAAKFEEAKGADVDDFGNLYVGGQSGGTWGTPFRAHSVGDDAFAAMFNANGSLKWNGFFGSPGTNQFGGLAADAAGNVYVAGSADRAWGNPVAAYGGGGDAFAAKVGNILPAVITVTSPNGGEVWTAGTAKSVAWTTQGILTNVKIDYTINGGSTWKVIAASATNTGLYAWTVPAVVSADCLVRVGAVGGGAPRDSSDAPFTIKAAPTITVTSPNGGEIWVCGIARDITWSSTGDVADVKIEYSTNGGASWMTIIASTSNTGTFGWTAPAVVSANCLVRVSEATTGTPKDRSNAVFKITDTAPTPTLSKKVFYFAAEKNRTPTPAQTTVLTNTGVGTMTWKATYTGTWLTVAPASGTGEAVLTISISRTNLAIGNYTRTIKITDPNATNAPQVITVHLKIKKAGKDAAPFGKFDAPAAGATLAGNVALAGWALDDIYVQAVKIYRGTGSADRVYIGDASFVRGSRPDVETKYPTYPLSDRAGWGYELLTNLLPGSGNGDFNLLAYALDSKGQETLLGSKAITCDNAGAVKPFGGINTPEIGGTATGVSYANTGWALTPLPDSIKADGSTITIYVDSAAIGHPSYSIYRADIEVLFPGLTNSAGAGGSFTLDTAGLSNGTHLIGWSVKDSGNDVGLIGSRYFTVLNLKASAGQASGEEEIAVEGATTEKAASLDEIAEDTRTPVYVKRGFDENTPAEPVYPDADGFVRITLPMMSRVALYLNPADMFESPAEARVRGTRILFEAKNGRANIRYKAYQPVSDELRPLPLGASFDGRDGVFYWNPGPAFLGEFTLIFMKNDSGSLTRKSVKITIG